jgi:hypothetical protein
MAKPERPEESLSDKWTRLRRLSQRGADADWDELTNLELDVLTGPIRSLEDALTKLKAVEVSFVEGERSDGADAEALRQAIRWLRANAKPAP